MNKRGLNMTYMFLGMIFLVGIIVLLFTAYNNFLVDNSMVMDPTIQASYSTLAGQQTTLGNLSADLTGESSSMFGSLADLPQNIFISMTIGLNALSQLLKLPAITNAVITSISETLPIPPIVSWMFITAIAVLFASLIIKAVRGGEQA